MNNDNRNFFRRHYPQFINFAKHSAKISTLGVGAAVVVGVLVYKFKTPVYASWTTSYQPPPDRKWNNNWDRREPSSLVRPPKNDASEEEKDNFNNKLVEATPKASRHIFLIRHGQYHDTAHADKDRFLTMLGREQAEMTGKRIKQLGLPYTSLTSSTMSRALETARIIHKYIPELQHMSDETLKEGAPIPPDPPIGSWRPEPQQFYVDGARIESAFRKYFHRAEASQEEDSYEIIVCHANVIRYFICRALQFEPEGWLRFSLAHASMTHVVIRPSGRVALRAVGDHGFMPPEKISFS